MFRFNIPLVKVDEEQRLVYGLVTEEVVDQSGEILDYETSKAYFEDWSGAISKATGGSSLGNLRLMHQPVVAGKIVELNFDDELKQISCVAKIVSDDVWKLVLEGCLTGFSMGGKYIKRWKDKANKAVTRFTAKPVEVSVVDNPCVQTATFEYVKSDGSIELRKFHSAGDGHQEDQSMFTQEQIAARAAELAKAAGTPDATDQYMDEALVQLQGEAEIEKAAAKKDGDAEMAAEGDEKPEGEESEEDDKDKKKPEGEENGEAEGKEPKKAVSPEEAQQMLTQVWQAPDGRTFSKKADGVSALTGEEPEPESAVEQALKRARGEADAVVVVTGDLQTLHADLVKAMELAEAAQEHVVPLAKGLYEVRELANVFTRLQGITSMAAWEAKHEADGSPVPTSLMEILQSMGAALIAMTQEEVAEALAMTGKEFTELLAVPNVCDVVELAAMGDMAKFTDLVEKAGARNSKRDADAIQKVHDHSVDLGAACTKAEEEGTEKTILTDELENTDLVKGLRADLEKRDGELTKAIEGIDALGEEMRELREKVEKFGKSPQPLPPRTDAIVLDRGSGAVTTITDETLAKMSPDEKADLAIRLSQQKPIRPA